MTDDIANKLYGDWLEAKEAKVKQDEFAESVGYSAGHLRRLFAKVKQEDGKPFLISHYDHVLKNVEKAADKIFSGKIKNNIKSKHYKKERILTLVLSDLHFGSDLKKDETGASDYGLKEEARRFAKIIEETVNYKPQYRDNTHLEVLFLGDFIQGKLHDPYDGAFISEQVCRCIHLLIQGVTHLANNFNSVSIRCASGNHSRLPRHKERATIGKWDSYATMIYFSVKKACKNLQNVQFFIPKTPYVTYEVFGKKVFATHGDTVLKVGNPGSVIRIGQLENMINKINSSLTDAQEYSVFIAGHVHTASMTHLPNGTTMVTNGMLVPVDNFAVSIGLFEANTGMWIFESVPEFAVGDSRYIRVGSKEDADATLEKIIQPWDGF